MGRSMSGLKYIYALEVLGRSSIPCRVQNLNNQHVIEGLQQAALRRLDEVLQTEMKRGQDVGKTLATDLYVDTANGENRTHDRRFTKPLLYL